MHGPINLKRTFRFSLQRTRTLCVR